MLKLHIVLVEPRIPQNTGSIARTCAVTGAQLHLVYPLGFSITDKNLKRAGLDYWDKLKVYHHKDLEQFFSEFPQADRRGMSYYFTAKAGALYTNVPYGEETFLIFGREDYGLDENILRAHPERCVRIPMRETLRCLNLSNSVAIAAYEYLRQHSFEGLNLDGRTANAPWESTPLSCYDVSQT